MLEQARGNVKRTEVTIIRTGVKRVCRQVKRNLINNIASEAEEA